MAPVAPPLVLVVDDQAKARDIYVRGPDVSGDRVVTASTAAAVARARARSPAAIPMDLAPPGTDGLEAIRCLMAAPLDR